MLNKVDKVYEPVFPCKKVYVGHTHNLSKQWKLETENIVNTCYIVLNLVNAKVAII